MANWKNKQVAFDLDNPEEYQLREFGRSILFTPIMKACLRLIKNGILKASFSKDGEIVITWHGQQQHENLKGYEEVAVTKISDSAKLNNIAQNHTNLYEFTQRSEQVVSTEEDEDQFVL